jgi:hypothetical protein
MWELETYLDEIEKSIEDSKIESQRLENLKKEYQNEKLNQNGCSDDAHLEIIISNIQVMDRGNFENLNVKAIMDNFNETIYHTRKEGNSFEFNKELNM